MSTFDYAPHRKTRGGIRSGQRLATVVLVAAMGALGCGDPSIHPSERRAVSALRAVGARRVVTDSEKHVVEIAVEGPRVTAGALAYLGDLTRLEKLDLSGAPLDRQSLAGLAQLKRLNTLDLTGFGSRSPMNDDALESLRGLDALVALNLTATQVGDAGMVCVSQLPSLERLFLANTKITDECRDSLAKLSRLRVLNTDGTQLSADARSWLMAQLPSLAKPYVPRSQRDEVAEAERAKRNNQSPVERVDGELSESTPTAPEAPRQAQAAEVNSK